MSYREGNESLIERIAELERRLRALEQPGALPPTRDWVLIEQQDGNGGNTLHWRNAATGAVGPAIGQTS